MNPHETYVSLETAKILKSAGFDWYVDQYYGSKPYIDGVLATGYRGDLRKVGAEWRLDKELTNCWYKNRQEELGYAAPTLSAAQKWLREVKNWEVNVITICKSDKTYSYVIFTDTYKSERIEEDFPTYEKAQEAGIQKCLEILLK